jgi:ribonuclease-3
MEKALHYTFKDPALLALALCHSSASAQNGSSNERLEFLGDRVLNFCVADMLFAHFPDEPEGILSKKHAALVRQETLADIATAIGLGAYLKLGKGEDASGGRTKPTILSDAMEAVIAALYLDGGLEAARSFITEHWAPRLEGVRYRDAKSRLQEWLQARGHGLPTYEVVETGGEAHARTFVVEVKTKALGCARGEGTSKQNAQQAAAKALLAQLEG